MTDLYQLTMMAADYDAHKAEKLSTFDLFVRKLPKERDFLVACGLEEAIKYLQNLKFTKDQIDYLSTLPEFSDKKDFLEKLKSFKFTGDVWAVKEGTPIFANEPILTIRAPTFQAQLVETYLLGIIGSRTMFASKAARIVEAAHPASAIEFGTRRSHDPEAAIGCARASYIAGFAGTSNLEAGRRYGIPVMGTMAHSFVMGFTKSDGADPELEAFRSYAKSFPEKTVLLVDTYDTEEGIKKAIDVAKEMEARGQRLFGIRIDSGDLAQYSEFARYMLDSNGLKYVKIMLSNDLDENKIAKLKVDNARFDSVGVGTMLATSSDAPNLGIVYKLVEQEDENGKITPRMKTSTGKTTLPCLKAVHRHSRNGEYYMDEICLPGEPYLNGARPILQMVMRNGTLLSKLPTLEEIKSYARGEISKLSCSGVGYEVRVSQRLQEERSKLMGTLMAKKVYA